MFSRKDNAKAVLRALILDFFIIFYFFLNQHTQFHFWYEAQCLLWLVINFLLVFSLSEFFKVCNHALKSH